MEKSEEQIINEFVEGFGNLIKWGYIDENNIVKNATGGNYHSGDIRYNKIIQNYINKNKLPFTYILEEEDYKGGRYVYFISVDDYKKTYINDFEILTEKEILTFAMFGILEKQKIEKEIIKTLDEQNKNTEMAKHRLETLNKQYTEVSNRLIKLKKEI